MKQANKLLVFDVETTGLLPKNVKLSPLSIGEFPHILQFSYLLYDVDKNDIIQTTDNYIKVDSNVVISPKITELTGITREKCNDGISILNALKEFYDLYSRSDVIVSHNMNFDRAMVLVELCRYREAITNTIPYIFTLFNKSHMDRCEMEMYCTMEHGVNVCNIMVESKTNPGKPYKKWPRLIELYEHLFDYRPENLHNSYIDSLLCLRCYLKMVKDIDNPEFDTLLPRV
jgi:DNA polymerase III epsilon subunit-like protein